MITTATAPKNLVVLDAGRRTGSGLAQHEQFYHVEEDQVKMNPSITRSFTRIHCTSMNVILKLGVAIEFVTLDSSCKCIIISLHFY